MPVIVSQDEQVEGNGSSSSSSGEETGSIKESFMTSTMECFADHLDALRKDQSFTGEDDDDDQEWW